MTKVYKYEQEKLPYYWKYDAERIYVITDSDKSWEKKLLHAKCRFMANYNRRGKTEKSQYICPVEMLKTIKTIKRKVVDNHDAKNQ